MPLHTLASHPMGSLVTRSAATSRRTSSWDRSGGNTDYLVFEPGETKVLFEHDGPGCVTHFYCALALNEITDYRDAIVRCYWDGETSPSVEAPLGDLFAISHARIRLIKSLMAVVNNGAGMSHGLNLYFPMPFSSGARITLTNRADQKLGGGLPAYWYHVEWEEHDRPFDDAVLRFHAQYRQERPTTAVGDVQNTTLHGARNVGGDENYVALEAEGAGHMVGLHLQINNIRGGWYGEGDDMVFLDGETWPPSIHGTGSEEIFGGGACPSTEYSGPYSGFHLIESPDFSGLVGMYRWYLQDPIRFQSSIKWTLEHGHANNFSNEYTSVAYWYQTEPHAPFPALPARDDMRPPVGSDYEEARELFFGALRGARERRPDDPGAMFRFGQIAERFYQGHFSEVVESLKSSS